MCWVANVVLKTSEFYSTIEERPLLKASTCRYEMLANDYSDLTPHTIKWSHKNRQWRKESVVIRIVYCHRKATLPNYVL